MEQSVNVLTAQARSDKGKGPARRLRQAGFIPAVVYGQKRDPTHISVDPSALQKAIATPHKFNTLLTLQLDGTEKRVLFREYEVDPVSRRLLHADFLEVDMAKAVKVEVPLVTTGKAEGVTAGGILTVSAHDITVEALPGSIPVRIEVDVTPLKIGGSLHIADVKAPQGVKIEVRHQLHGRRRLGTGEGRGGGRRGAGGRCGAGRRRCRGCSGWSGGRSGRGSGRGWQGRGSGRRRQGGRQAGQEVALREARGRPGKPGGRVRADPSQHRVPGRRRARGAVPGGVLGEEVRGRDCRGERGAGAGLDREAPDLHERLRRGGRPCPAILEARARGFWWWCTTIPSSTPSACR